MHSKETGDGSVRLVASPEPAEEMLRETHEETPSEENEAKRPEEIADVAEQYGDQARLEALSSILRINIDSSWDKRELRDILILLDSLLRGERVEST